MINITKTQWRKDREKRLIRNPDGSFKDWRGGTESESYHGTKVKLGQEFKRQHDKKAEIGDIVRTKTIDGTYHKNSEWYVKTRHGWRRVSKRKPTALQIRNMINYSRPGRNTRSTTTVKAHTRDRGKTSVRSHKRRLRKKQGRSNVGF